MSKNFVYFILWQSLHQVEFLQNIITSSHVSLADPLEVQYIWVIFGLKVDAVSVESIWKWNVESRPAVAFFFWLGETQIFFIFSGFYGTPE